MASNDPEFDAVVARYAETKDGRLVVQLTGVMDLVADRVRAALVQRLVEELQRDGSQASRDLAGRLAGLRVIREFETAQFHVMLP